MINNSGLNRNLLKSSTIHSYLGLKLQYEEDKVKLITENLFSKTNIDRTNVLIIDESSMVSEELYNFILKDIKKKANQLKAVIFIGDKFQLLPVEGLQNPVYKNIKNQSELTEIIRQASNSGILQYATAVRKEIEYKTFNLNAILDVPKSKDIIIYNKETELIKDFCLNKEKDKIMSSFTNLKTDYYNAFARQYEFRDYPSLPEFVEGENLIMQSAYKDNMLKNGEEVYITKLQKEFNKELGIYFWRFAPNDKKDEYVDIVAKESLEDFNNKLKEISDRAKTFKRDRYFKECSDTWALFWGIKNKFAEVKHTYSSTIHKLQGSTYKEVYINIPEIISTCKNKEDLFRLVYVAVTRASKLLKVYKE
jgi:ATP-dependent exoDNAse (exonuclease V) alpha subunit